MMGVGGVTPGKVVPGCIRKQPEQVMRGKPVSSVHLCFCFSSFLQVPAQLGSQPWLPSVDGLGAKFVFDHVVLSQQYKTN